MENVIQEKMTSEMEGEFVVFLIGMRVNRFWKIHKWLPVMLAMPKMIKELHSNPELGLLHQESWFGRTTIMVQYWKSFEHLEKYASSRSSEHLPAWSAFNKHIGSNGDVGIWHETYLCQPGNHECIYNNMPRFGLAQAGKHIPITKNLRTANERLKHNT